MSIYLRHELKMFNIYSCLNKLNYIILKIKRIHSTPLVQKQFLLTNLSKAQIRKTVWESKSQLVTNKFPTMRRPLCFIIAAIFEYSFWLFPVFCNVCVYMSLRQICFVIFQPDFRIFVNIKRCLRANCSNIRKNCNFWNCTCCVYRF